MSSRRSLTTRAALLVAAAGVSFALYAQTLNLRPGLYEFTSSPDVQLPPDVAAKLPPQALARMQQPRVSQHCITQTDLDHVSQQLAQRGADDGPSCKVTDHSIVGNQVKFTTQCAHGGGHFEGTFASDSFQGTMVASGAQGRTVTVRMTARRVGDCSK